MTARLIAFFSAFALLFSVPVYAYELPEEFGFLNVSSPSDAVAIDYVEFPPVEVSSSVGNVTPIIFSFYDNDWRFVANSMHLDSSGSFTVKFNDSSYSGLCHVVQITIPKSCFPPVGKYKLDLKFYSITGGFDLYTGSLLLRDSMPNSLVKDFNFTPSFTAISGDWSLTANVDLTNVDVIFYTYHSNSGLSNPYGGYFSINWTPLDASSAANGFADSSASSEQNMQNNISDMASGIGDLNAGVSELNGNLNMTNESIGHISSYLGEVNGHLENLIHTISLQLEALWNQLYNSMHLEQLANDDKNTDKIVDAIDDIDVSLNNSNDKLISNDNRLAQSQEAAEQQRHQDTLYGYDTSEDTAKQESAASEIEAYEDMEDQIIDSVSSTLESFELQSPDSVITGELAGAFIQVSNWFQLLYDSSGMFHVILIVGLSLGVALMIIGFYRVQNGG